MTGLQNNVDNCEKLMQSGKVKDYKRMENLKLMVNKFNKQIKELEKSKLYNHDALLQQ